VDNSFWIVIAVTAVGTFAMRSLPLLWMQRHLEKRDSNGGIDDIPLWLSISGPCMIAAMTGTSLIPATADITGWLATLIGSIMTLLCWYKTRSLGWPIVVGVTVFGLIRWLADYGPLAS
jgi:branched-subunit amino acid transport protein